MTVINVSAALTALGGNTVVTRGHVLVEYLRGVDARPALRAEGPLVVLPSPIRIAIEDGGTVEPLDVPPTDGSCYARLTVAADEPYVHDRFRLPAVAIPDGAAVDITDLLAVDPASYEPITTVVTAWQLAIDEAQRIRTAIDARATEVADDRARAEDAAVDAGEFAKAAEFDAGRAGDSAFEAGKSAAIALGHRNAAKTSEDAAAGSAGAAAASVVAANGERIGAGDERAGARQERLDAQTARAGAETARGGAETAQAGAVTARGGAESARAGAEQARDVALAGQFAGTQVASTGADLNTLTTAGIYRFTSTAAAASTNSPSTVAGVLRVYPIANGVIEQEYASNSIRGLFLRTGNGTTFSAWIFLPGHRMNNPTTEPGYEYLISSDTVTDAARLLPWGIQLGATDLNAVTLPGHYLQNNGSNSTLARNYPIASPGVLEVFRWGAGSGFPVQRYTLFPNVGASPQAIAGSYIRGIRSNDTWGPWRFQPTQRINNPGSEPGVGVLTWDDANGRELSLMPVDIALGSFDLNAVLLPGVYRQSDSASATLARNYPLASGIGVMRVSNSGNTALQEYVVTTGSGPARGTYLRRYIYSSATWTAWAFVASQRVDQTAGRAIYTWDDVNGREQLIYGDTGWRSLATADLMSGWKITGHVRIRRINNMVFFRFSGIDGSEATADNIYQLPTGFRPEAQNRALPAIDNLTPIAIRFPSNGQILMPNRTISLLTYAAEFGPIITADPWPTALPGTASGGIPNA